VGTQGVKCFLWVDRRDGTPPNLKLSAEWSEEGDMTSRRIISISRYRGRLDPELGLICQRVAILVTGRHIGTCYNLLANGAAGLNRRKSRVGNRLVVGESQGS
jgi:hypothetical protein